MKEMSKIIALALMVSVVLSSLSLVFTMIKATQQDKNPGSIPDTAFEGLGGKKGVGFGNWALRNGANTELTIFLYPAGENETSKTNYVPSRLPAGWSDYLVDMLVTVTVALDTASSGGTVKVIYHHLVPHYDTNYNKYWTQETTIMPLEVDTVGMSVQSATFSGQIYNVTLSLQAAGGATTMFGGHYFVSADRRT